MTRERVENWLTECAELVTKLHSCKLMDDDGERFASQISLYEKQIQIVGLLDVAHIIGATTKRVDNSIKQDMIYPIEHSFRYKGVTFCEVMTRAYEEETLSRLEGK